MMPVLDRFQEIAGPKLGYERFNSLAQHIGASTAGAKPPQNVKMASYWDYLARRGDPAPPRSLLESQDPLTRLSVPQGYGSTPGRHARANGREAAREGHRCWS